MIRLPWVYFGKFLLRNLPNTEQIGWDRVANFVDRIGKHKVIRNQCIMTNYISRHSVDHHIKGAHFHAHWIEVFSIEYMPFVPIRVLP